MKEITAALVKLQAALPSVAKGQRATVKSDKGSYTYKYADLAAVSAAILPLLATYDMAWTTAPTVEDGKFVLRYQLAHTSGETISGAYPLPSPGRPQEAGSAITYARRYSLCAVTGLAPEGDDDGAVAAEKAASAREAREAMGINFKNAVWSEARKRGWIGEDQNYDELQADFVTWSAGEGGDGVRIEEAPDELMGKYLAHLRPTRTMQRGKP